MRVIKVVAHKPQHGQEFELSKHHAERVVLNFEADDEGGVAYPMRYQCWSDAKLSETESADIYEQLRAGAAADETESGVFFALRKHLFS